MKEAEIDISKILPIQSIEDSCLINGNGDITVGFQILLPEVFLYTVEDGERWHEEIYSILKILPPGCIIHKQDFFFIDKYKSNFRESDNYTYRSNLEYYHFRSILKHYSNIYLSFPTNKHLKRRGSNTSYIKLSDYLFKKPFKDVETQIDKTKNAIRTFENGMNGIKGFRVKRMDNNKLGCAYYDYLSLSYNDPSETYTDKTLQPIKVEKDYIKIGTQYATIVSMIQEPEKMYVVNGARMVGGDIYNNGIEISGDIRGNTNFLFPITFGLPINHIVNSIIEIGDGDKVLGDLNKEYNLLKTLSSFHHAGALAKQNCITSFINTVTEYNFSVAKTGLNVILHNSSLDELEKNISITENAFSKMNQMKCWVENFDNANLFFSSCPGNAHTNYRCLTNTVEQSVCYVNLEGGFASDKTGITFVDKLGKPVVVDMWDSKYLTSRNKLVIGPTGKGKSFFINNLVDQTLYLGNHVIMIDIGHSYRRNNQMNKGIYFDSGNKENLQFNIFLCDKDSKGNYLYMDTEDDEASEDKINFVYSVVVKIWKQDEHVNQEEKAILKDIIKEFYEYINREKIFPDMMEFQNFISIYKEKIFTKKPIFKGSKKEYLDFNSLMILLNPYVVGEHKKLLNSKTNIDILNDRFIVFDLENISKNADIFPIVSIIIMELVTQKIKRLRGVRKSFIIDEGLDFLKDEKMGDFIAYLYRTFRKKEGEVYLAAQDVNFLKEANTEIQNSIVRNSDTKILLDHSSQRAAYDDLMAILSLTDDDIKMLDTLQFKEFFMKMGDDRSMVLKVDVSEKTECVYTSKEKEVIEIEKIYERVNNLGAAINIYINNKYKEEIS